MTKYVLLDGRLPTGGTRHTFDGVEVGVPAMLRIVQLVGDSGYYLIHFDGQGGEISDTYHEAIEDAMKQAEWEFGVKPEEWQEWSN